ncbi:hypothetical protein Dimus_035502 [Dionaea muscipula]
MSEADHVLGSSAMHNDAGELRIDGHERGITTSTVDIGESGGRPVQKAKVNKLHPSLAMISTKRKLFGTCRIMGLFQQQ